MRPHIDTSPNPIYDVADPGERWSLYSAVVRDGLTGEQAAILNRELLVGSWAGLNLPARCHAVWEDRFPELAELSRRRVS